MTGQEIRALRGDLAVSRFASLIGVAPSTVYLWECGRRNPMGSALILMELLGKDFAFYLNELSEVSTKLHSKKMKGI